MIKVGLIGAGYWGAKHVRNLVEIPEAEVGLVCDTSPDRLAALKKTYPWIRVTQAFQDVLESDLDGVIVATPPRTDFRLAEQILVSGKHVLVEKPVATGVEETAMLIEAAERRGLHLMAGHTYEYNAAVEFLKDYLASGELGDVFCIDSARLNLGLFQSNIDVVWDLAPHDVSMITYILGETPEYVSARGAGHVNPSRVEVAHVEMLFSRNVMAHIHVSWLDPCKVRCLTIVGSRKMVVFDDLSELDRIRIYDKGVSIMAGPADLRYPPVSYRDGVVHVPQIPFYEPSNAECRHFVECISTGSTPRSNGESAMRVARILEAASMSLERDGARLAIRPVDISIVGG